MADTIQRAGALAGLAEHASSLGGALERLRAATDAAWSTGVPEEALANATPYLQAFGHVVLAWVWLDLAITCQGALAAGRDTDFHQGKLHAMRYFFRYELPKIDAWLGVVASRDPTCRDMQDTWF